MLTAINSYTASNDLVLTPHKVGGFTRDRFLKEVPKFNQQGLKHIQTFSISERGQVLLHPTPSWGNPDDISRITLAEDGTLITAE